MPTFKDISLFSTMTVQEIKSMNTAGNGPFVQVDAEHKVNLKDVVTAFAPAAPNPLNQALTGLAPITAGVTTLTSTDTILSALNKLAARLDTGKMIIRYLPDYKGFYVALPYESNQKTMAIVFGQGAYGYRVILKRNLGISATSAYSDLDSTIVSLLDQGYNLDAEGGNILMWKGIRTVTTPSALALKPGDYVYVTAISTTIGVSSNYFGAGDTAIVFVTAGTRVLFSSNLKKSEGIEDLDTNKLRVYTVQKFNTQTLIVNGCAYE